VEILSYSLLSDIRKRHCFLESDRSSPFSLSGKTNVQMKMNAGYWWHELTGEDRITMRKTLPIATLATTNPTRTELESHSGLPDKRLATNEPWHGLCEDRSTLHYIYI